MIGSKWWKERSRSESRLTIRSSRDRFAAAELFGKLSQRRGRKALRLNSGVSPQSKCMATSDKSNRTELHYAAINGNVEAARSLIANGGDPNAQDSQGWSPLHFAAQSGSVPIVELLLVAGANTELRDLYGNTPLSRAVFNSNGDGAIISMLRAAGADPLAENSSGVSPLSLARSIANYDVARFFADLAEG